MEQAISQLNHRFLTEDLMSKEEYLTKEKKLKLSIRTHYPILKTMRLKDLHTLHVTALGGHDKINGNYYFGTQLVTNLTSHKPQMTLKYHSKNGYDDQYLYPGKRFIKRYVSYHFWAKKGGIHAQA